MADRALCKYKCYGRLIKPKPLFGADDGQMRQGEPAGFSIRLLCSWAPATPRHYCLHFHLENVMDWLSKSLSLTFLPAF